MSIKYYVQVGNQFVHKNDAAQIKLTGKRFVLKDSRFAFFSEVAANEARKLFSKSEIIKEGEDNRDKYFVLPDGDSAIGESKPSRIERVIEEKNFEM